MIFNTTITVHSVLLKVKDITTGRKNVNVKGVLNLFPVTTSAGDSFTLELECTIQSPTTNKNDENMYDISCINDCMYEDYYNCLDSYGFVTLGPLQRFPQLNSQSISKMGYVGLHSLLAGSRTPNCIGSQLVVPLGLNLPLWEHHLKDYWDHQLIFYLKYGFPTNTTGFSATGYHYKPFFGCPTSSFSATLYQH